MTKSDTLPLLVGGRLLVGGAALVAPRRTGRLFGIRVEDNPSLPYVARLFGVRAVAMGLLVATTTGDERVRQLRSGLRVDAVDALAAVISGSRREMPRRAAWLACVAALAELSMGLATLASGRSQRIGSLAVQGATDRDARPRADDQNRSRV